MDELNDSLKKSSSLEPEDKSFSLTNSLDSSNFQEETLSVNSSSCIEDAESHLSALASSEFENSFNKNNDELNLSTFNSSDSEIEQLRNLLFYDERLLLKALKERFEDPNLRANDVSKVIAEAFLLRTKKDDRLSVTLQPTVEQIFKESVRKNPAALANSISPLIGSAIRKAIAESFRNMLSGFNKALEMSFSLTGLKWRFEALRTGTSFSEVVLLHTLEYRVEQVFLIHAQTGLVIDHVVKDGVAFQDANLVGGMLTAIQDFVKDSFLSGGESLERLDMGDRTVIMEKGPEAVLVFVVRGNLPHKFLDNARNILDLIHVEGQELFANFSGDMKDFAYLRRYLDDFLVERFSYEDKKKLPFLIKCLPVAILLIAIIIPSFLYYQNNRFHNAVNLLDVQPGIIVSDANGDYFSGWEINLARDPLAENPKELMESYGIDTSKIVFNETPFASLEPNLVITRLRRAMEAPDSVTFKFENGVLYLIGKASINWIYATKEKALAVPGIESVDTSGISDPRTILLQNMLTKIESTVIEFPMGKDVPDGAEYAKMVEVVNTLAELSKLSKEMGLSASLIIYGHTDSTGSEKRNYELSEGRAKTLASLMYSRGIAMPIATYGFGSKHLVDGNSSSSNLDANQRSRRLDLRVHLSFLGNSLFTLDKDFANYP